MLFKKLIRTFGKYKAQFISMIVMVILGVGIFAGFNAEWYSIDKDTTMFFEETVLADYRIYNEKKSFSLDDVEKVMEIDGVEKATRYFAVDTKESKENDIIKLTVSENFTVSKFKLMEGNAYDETKSNALWISQKYASLNDYKVGDKITLTYGSVTKELNIEGICLSGEYLINTHGSALMPDYEGVGYAYVTPAFYENLSNELFGMVYYPQINVVSSLDNETFSKKVDEALKSTLQIVPKDDVTSYSQAKGESDEGKTMGLMLPIIFLMIAILTMVTTMNRITTNEKVQIGILKALGFKNKRITWHYTSYALTIGLVGGVVGLALGYGVANAIFSASGSMGTYFEMPYWTIHMPPFVYIGIILIIAFLTLIGFLSVKKQLKGSAAEALRPYEPKKMKSFAIEKTKLFHKLNFATRYNMRDSLRHKTRMFMSVFGVFGCTLLLFATFGMKSTMSDYIALNYDVVMNYQSSLNLDDKVTNARAKELAEYYEGDYSSTIATKIDGKTYVMTLLNNKEDKVRLLDKRSAIKELSSEGIYICERMSSELNLKVGDLCNFTLYGKTQVYEVPVIKIVNSNTKGFTLTYDLADTLGLDYKIDTIYTDVKKDEIQTNNEIVSLSSKEDIMKTFDTFMDIMNMMIYLLVAFSSLLAFVVLYNLGTMSYIERYRELATLKVLGFKNRKIRWILITQNLASTIIGILLGCPAGYGAIVGLYKLLASEYELTVTCSWYVYVISIVVTFLVSLIVSYFTSIKVKKINMVESLKAE